MSTSHIQNHGFYGGIFWREHHFIKKGDKHKGHRHHIDHATIIIRGSVEVDIEGKKQIVKAPSVIAIDKDKFHQFTSLEDDTVYFCVFATNDLKLTTLKRDSQDMTKELAKILCADCDGCEKV